MNQIIKQGLVKRIEKRFSLFDKNVDSVYKHQENHRRNRNKALISLFVQQCQLISIYHGLLPYVEAWKNNQPVNQQIIKSYKSFKTISQNIYIKLSCCFNNVVILNEKTSLKFGVLKHDCSYTDEYNDLIKSLVFKEIVKWYAKNDQYEEEIRYIN